MIGVTMLLLAACEDLFRPSITTICEEHPQLCAGLNKDGWCRAEKAEIIRHRFDHLNDNSDDHIYRLLRHYESYEVCIEKAAQIRHIKYRDKEADRMQGYLTAQQAIKDLSRETRDSTDPHLQYYHWSRHQDETAKARFLAQARRGNFNSPELWVMVASVHLKRDNEKARKALYKALSFYQDIDEVNQDIFKSLITVNLDDERYASAFVWANVYAEVNEAGEAALEDTRPLVLQPINTAALSDIADKIEDAINQGSFNADRVGLWRLK
jgi:hypothetical protein